MRILYLSCHSILEYEDIKLFTELGHEVLSQGAYKFPLSSADNLRPPIPEAYRNEELRPLLHLTWGSPIPQPLIDWCELIYILGVETWLPTNWERIKHKHVVWRSIGQAVDNTEKVIAKYRPEGLKVVRYSPFESRISGYAGGDVIIRFYKDQDEYKGWNGSLRQVITVAQSMQKRGRFLKYNLFDQATTGFPRKLYGTSNEDTGELWGGVLSYEELKQVLRDNRVFFYTCTWPAPYTMAFQEAWMTGIPVVAIGRALADFRGFGLSNLEIEVPSFINNGVNGFTSDSIPELRNYVSQLLEDHSLAKRIGEEGRKSAIELFGKEKIKREWEQFFNSL